MDSMALHSSNTHTSIHVVYFFYLFQDTARHVVDDFRLIRQRYQTIIALIS